MTNLYEAGELLSMVQRIIEDAKGRPVQQTSDGRDPVYWPITIHGRTGMMTKDDFPEEKTDPHPPRAKIL